MKNKILVPLTILSLYLFAALAFGDTGLPRESVFEQWDMNFRATPCVLEEFEDQTLVIRSLNQTARCCLRCGPKHPKTGDIQCRQQCGDVCK